MKNLYSIRLFGRTGMVLNDEYDNRMVWPQRHFDLDAAAVPLPIDRLRISSRPCSLTTTIPIL